MHLVTTGVAKNHAIDGVGVLGRESWNGNPRARVLGRSLWGGSLAAEVLGWKSSGRGPGVGVQGEGVLGWVNNT